jgi:formylglycine-generating enzyme required for sulfatase activity
MYTVVDMESDGDSTTRRRDSALKKQPTACSRVMANGVHDTIGNAWEWTTDWWSIATTGEDR